MLILFNMILIQNYFEYLCKKKSKTYAFLGNCLRLFLNKLNDSRKYLVARFKSFGNPNFNRWADALDKYCRNYENLIKVYIVLLKSIFKIQRFFLLHFYLVINFSKLIVFQKKSNSILNDKFLQQTKFNSTEKKQQLIDNFPLFIVKYSQINNEIINTTDMLYNKKFLNLIEYDIDSFVTSLFNHGIPE